VNDAQAAAYHHGMRGPRKQLRWPWVLGGFLFLAVALPVGVKFAHRNLRAEAEAAARGSLEPLRVEDLRRGKQGDDPGPWLVLAATTKPRWSLDDLATTAGRDAVLARLDAGECGDAGRAAASTLREAWRAEPGSNEDAWPSLVARLGQRMDEGAGIEPWLASERALLAVHVLGVEPLVNLANQARNLGSSDPQAVARAVDPQETLFPSLPMLEELRLAQACRATALHGALRQDAGIFQAGIDGAIALAKLHEQPDWLGAAALHIVALEVLCATLELCISHLPPEWDLEPVKVELELARPREALRRGMIGERAFGLRVWDAWDDEFRSERDGMLGRISDWILIDRDRAEYMDMWRQALAAARLAHHQRDGADARLEDGPDRLAVRSRLMTPPLRSQLEAADRMEARLLLARGALVARHGGAKEALPWFGESRDPYDARPVRLALGADGLVQAWCVGPDGKDDEGHLESDVTWRMRLP
jgi:hypothetical protein